MNLKVKNEAGLVRDSKSKAVLNTDDQALKAYKKQRSKALQLQEAMEEIPQLRQEVAEIKDLIKQLLGKL